MNGPQSTMHFEFIYGASVPFVSTSASSLQMGITNTAWGPNRERWAIAKGNRVQNGNFHYIESPDLLVGAATIKVSNATLAAQSEALYRQLLTVHPEYALYRIWHFVPNINDTPPGQLENYQAFCQGRALAFEAYGNEPFHTKIPAASAVGTDSDYLSIAYIAGPAPATHIENPRQTPAYEYPREYGPKPPSFARASAIDDHHNPRLYISGTASILASESIGTTIEEQCAITLENLTIMAERHQATGTPLSLDSPRKVRVYIRHESDFPYIKQALERDYLRPQDQVFYLQADICRKELLVEIEVTAGV